MSTPEGAFMIDAFVKPPLPMINETINTQNEAVGAVQVSISEQPLGVGGGVAHAEIEDLDSALELSRSVAMHLVPIVDGIPTDCGDGRECVGTNTGEENLPSPHLFGGSVNATLGMQVIDGAVAPGIKYEDAFATVANTLTAAGQRLGAHTDTHAHGESSNCGSLDKAQGVFAAVGNNGEALLPLTEYITKKLGYVFDTDEYTKQVERAAAYAESNSFASWNGKIGLDETVKSGGLVRNLDGGEDGDVTHGHHENLITVITEPGITLDKARYLQANQGKQVFVVTLPQLTAKAEIMTANPDALAAKQEVAKKVQAGVLFQLGHALVVPDGSQYLQVISK